MSELQSVHLAGARFAGRHVSLLHALRAYGLDGATASALLQAAARAGRTEVQFVAPAALSREPSVVVLRRMRGNHAHAWELPVPAGTGPSDLTR